MNCEQRKLDLQTLRDNAEYNVVFEHKGEEYMVDQLITQNIIWEEGSGVAEETSCSQFIDKLTWYADMGSGIEKQDKEWMKYTIRDVASDGFKHIINYCNFRHRTSYKNKPIEIVEGFLVLENNINYQPIP
jgi:hypothetical protein